MSIAYSVLNQHFPLSLLVREDYLVSVKWESTNHDMHVDSEIVTILTLYGTSGTGRGCLYVVQLYVLKHVPPSF